MSSLRDRLRLLQGVLGALVGRGDLNQRELAAMLKVGPQYLSDVLNGRKQRFGWESLEALAEAGVNLNWFVRGSGSVCVPGDAESPPGLSDFLVLAEKHPDFAARLLELSEDQVASLRAMIDSLSRIQ